MRLVLLKTTQILSAIACLSSVIGHGIALLMPVSIAQKYLPVFICVPLPIAGLFWSIWRIDVWRRYSSLPWFRPDQNKFLPPGWLIAKRIFRLYTLIGFIFLIMVTIHPNLSTYSDGMIMKFTTLFTAWATLEAWLFFAFIAPNLDKPIRWYSDIKDK